MDLLRAITVFVMVAEGQSFTAAADRLVLSRTMVSKHVMDLEAHLGTRLLNRTTRRLSLTGTGAVYLERARQIIAQLEEANREASLQSLIPRGRLKVNAPMSFGISQVAPTLRAYLERYPDIEVDLSLNDRVVDLVDEGYDVAVRIGALADSSLIARRLATCRLVVCAAPAYLEAHGLPRHPEDLTGHQCLGYTYGPGRDNWRFQGPEGSISVRVKQRLFSNNGDALMAGAASGLGIILQPAFIVHQALEDGRLVEVLAAYPAGELTIHAIYPPTRHLSARVRTFIDHLVACYQPRTPWETAKPGAEAS